MKYMNKSLILFFATIFSLLGSYVPVLLGETALGGWSILGGFIGGLFGIWLGVFVSRRWG